MFQLRYLIASDRRLSPVRFTHRSHRLQGTAPDDFHPGHKTFICDSYEQFREIFEHEVRHNPTAKIVPLIELHNPATGERRHIDGTEQVLTADILGTLEEQAQLAGTSGVSSDSQAPLPTPPAPDQPPQTPTTEPEAPSTTANASDSEAPPPAPVSLADRIKPLVTEKKRTVTDLANDLGVSKDVITTVVKTEGSGLTYASGWVGLAE